MKGKSINIGGSDFETIIRNNYLYVDKTLLIRDLIDSASAAILFTRPRRFGKSLNMSMLKSYFEQKTETAQLFYNLNIWQCGEKYQQEQGKYPVIYLSLFDFSEPNWEDALSYLKTVIADEFIRHNYIFESGILIQEEKERYKALKDRSADTINYKRSLKDLAKWLYQYHGVKPIILIDEYDKPLQGAYTRGYYNEVIDFMKGLYTSGLKDNPCLHKGILTGVLKIAKESIFTGMNNFDSYSIFNKEYSEYFGFTQAEVHELAECYGTGQDMEVIREWYDGYYFGNSEIYNPWSVLQYFARGRVAEAYWLSTSGNDIIHTMFRNISVKILEDLTALVQGSSVMAGVPLELTYPDIELDESGQALYAVLLMTGYLKKGSERRLSGNMRTGQNLKYRCELLIPNREIMEVYQTEILEYIERFCKPEISDAIQVAIAENDVPSLQKELSLFLMESTSNYDGAYEVFYHGLVMGYVAMMRDGYYVTFNLESGEGRFDIQLEPKRKELPGIIIEIKAVREKQSDMESSKLEQEALKALEQIEKNEYITNLKMRGIQHLVIYGMAFQGKHVKVLSREWNEGMDSFT